jgi:hypothetical protein
MKLDVVFVCQQGELEIQAALLAASLRHHCDDDVVLHAILPIPEHVYGTVSPTTRRFLDSLGVDWCPFANPVSDEFGVFNKLNAFNVPCRGDRILFLDSDTIVRRPLHGLEAYVSRPFAAKCGYHQAFSADEDEWRLAYGMFGLPLPRMRWPAADSREWGPPYFNAAVILVDPALDFSTVWIDTCARIHRDETFWASVKSDSRGTVQIGLPVALARRDIPYALLDTRFHAAWSGRRSRRNQVWSDEEGAIVHYGNAGRMAKSIYLLSDVRTLMMEFPLEEVLTLLPSWGSLLVYLEELEGRSSVRPHSSLFVPGRVGTGPVTPPAVPRGLSNGGRPRPVIITGLPDAGAAEFASLLASHANVAMEPGLPGATPDGRVGLHPETKTAAGPADVGSAAGSRDGRAGRGHTTAIAEDRLAATLEGADILPRISEIVQKDPHAAIFVLVRHPFATVALWARRSDAGDPDELAGGSVPLSAWALSKEQREQLDALRALADPAMRRAGLWDYLACLASQHLPQVHIVRHEDLIADPGAVLSFACGVLFPGVDVSPMVGRPEPRPRAEPARIGRWDAECVRAICSNSTGAFGYELYGSCDDGVEVGA